MDLFRSLVFDCGNQLIEQTYTGSQYVFERSVQQPIGKYYDIFIEPALNALIIRK